MKEKSLSDYITHLSHSSGNVPVVKLKEVVLRLKEYDKIERFRGDWTKMIDKIFGDKLSGAENRGSAKSNGGKE